MLKRGVAAPFQHALLSADGILTAHGYPESPREPPCCTGPLGCLRCVDKAAGLTKGDEQLVPCRLRHRWHVCVDAEGAVRRCNDVRIGIDLLRQAEHAEVGPERAEGRRVESSRLAQLVHVYSIKLERRWVRRSLAENGVPKHPCPPCVDHGLVLVEGSDVLCDVSVKRQCQSYRVPVILCEGIDQIHSTPQREAQPPAERRVRRADDIAERMKA